jgi:hypothetical protein
LSWPSFFLFPPFIPFHTQSLGWCWCIPHSGKLCVYLTQWINDVSCVVVERGAEGTSHGEAKFLQPDCFYPEE